jgi:hypothetical protein
LNITVIPVYENEGEGPDDAGNFPFCGREAMVHAQVFYHSIFFQAVIAAGCGS